MRGCPPAIMFDCPRRRLPILQAPDKLRPPKFATPGFVIDGATVQPLSGEWFDTYDPSTGETICPIPAGGAEDIDAAVRAAQRAFEVSRARTTPRARAEMLSGIAARIRGESDVLVELDTRTAGLPLKMAKADVDTAARYFEYYAGIADKLHGESIPLGPDFLNYTEREPYGVCAIIPPFNVPLQLTARSLAPALAAGNTAVIKPAEQAPLPALRLGQLILDAGAPNGLVNVVTGTGPDAGRALVAHRDVAHITFTGSLSVGQSIMRDAAAQLTPITLELGGKSPQIVFADADLDAAAAAICASALFTAGQVCSAGTRILVEKAIHPTLRALLEERTNRIVIGRAGTDADMGPLISRTQQHRVLAAIGHAREEGAEVITGGRAPSGDLGDGYFVEPTVLDRITPGMRVAQDEVFGPVIALIDVEDEDHAVLIANDSEFGLAAGVWTRDLGRAHRVARAVNAGQVFVNNYGVAGGVELPFGGYRKSGIGREKGIAAIHEYTQIKNVCVQISA
jgi:aldehyde dehydrogenase (NAD+)